MVYSSAWALAWDNENPENALLPSSEPKGTMQRLQGRGRAPGALYGLYIHPRFTSNPNLSPT